MRRCEYCTSNTDVHMGGNLTPKRRTFLLGSTADLGIPVGILRYLCADVSIAGGILMFILGLTSRCRTFFFGSTADFGIPWGILRFVCTDVSIAGGMLMFIWGKSNAESDLIRSDLI